MLKKLSQFYHPTAAVFIDDQEMFIHSTLAIVNNLTDCRSFLEPQEALEYLSKVKVGDYFLENFVTNKSTDPVIISKKALIKYLSSLERFVMESTLIVDYAMPGLNGLDLCKKLKAQPFKKIMLTGEASSEIGDTALTQHIIDRFIHKNNPKVFEDLNQDLLELRVEFFEDLSSNLDISSMPDYMNTQAFSDFFMQMFNKFKGVEYYRVNNFGDFLIIDEDGYTTWLCVRDNESHEAVKTLVAAHYKKKPNDDLGFAHEHLSKGKDYLLVYGFGTFERGYRDLVLPAHAIKFDRQSCYYAALPVKLDLQIKPLSLQSPQYILNKGSV